MINSQEIFLEIRKPNGELIYSNFTAEESDLFERRKNNEAGAKVKTRIIERREFRAKFLTKDEDLVNSARLFSKAAKGVENTISFFVQNLVKLEFENRLAMNRLEHNLETYNALTLQEIEVLIPQSQIAGKTWPHKLDYVKKQLGQNITDTSEAMLRIAKYAQGTKAELTAYDVLYRKNSSIKRMQQHHVYQVLMNSLHLFFTDFNDNGVQVSMQHNNVNGLFDYESVSVVLYHILANAAKYCLPKSPITISIMNHGSEIKIEFSMMSIRIDDSETKKIFIEGYSGIHTTKAKVNGRGVGMFVAKELMKVNGGDIEVKINRSTNKMHGGTLFEQNQFILTLKSV